MRTGIIFSGGVGSMWRAWRSLMLFKQSWFKYSLLSIWLNNAPTWKVAVGSFIFGWLADKLQEKLAPSRWVQGLAKMAGLLTPGNASTRWLPWRATYPLALKGVTTQQKKKKKRRIRRENSKKSFNQREENSLKLFICFVFFFSLIVCELRLFASWGC